MPASDRQFVVSTGKTPERKNNREYSFELPGLPEKQTSATSLAAGRLSISNYMDFWFICEEPRDPVFPKISYDNVFGNDIVLQGRPEGYGLGWLDGNGRGRYAECLCFASIRRVSRMGRESSLCADAAWVNKIVPAFDVGTSKRVLVSRPLNIRTEIRASSS